MQEFIELKDGVVPLNIKEQRLSNLIQALLIAASIVAAPAIRFIPKSVLWGYFAYMALESLPGSEFWDRILLVFTDHRKRCASSSPPCPPRPPPLLARVLRSACPPSSRPC